MAVPRGFDIEVYAVATQIPRDKVLTSGQVAELIGMSGYARRADLRLALRLPSEQE